MQSFNSFRISSQNGQASHVCSVAVRAARVARDSSPGRFSVKLKGAQRSKQKPRAEREKFIDNPHNWRRVHTSLNLNRSRLSLFELCYAALIFVDLTQED